MSPGLEGDKLHSESRSQHTLIRRGRASIGGEHGRRGRSRSPGCSRWRSDSRSTRGSQGAITHRSQIAKHDASRSVRPDADPDKGDGEASGEGTRGSHKKLRGIGAAVRRPRVMTGETGPSRPGQNKPLSWRCQAWACAPRGSGKRLKKGSAELAVDRSIRCPGTPSLKRDCKGHERESPQTFPARSRREELQRGIFVCFVCHSTIRARSLTG